MNLSLRVAAPTLVLVVLTASLADVVVAFATEDCFSPEVGDFNCYTESVVREEVRPKWGPDGLAPGTNLSTATPPHATWPRELTHGVKVPDGIHIGASFESRGALFSSNNTTATPTTHNLTVMKAANLRRTLSVQAVHALQYHVTFNATDISNGQTEFFWRSPMLWTNASYTGHYIQIHDELGRLVFGARYLLTDDSTDVDDALLHQDRLYYRFSGVLYSGTRYRIDEYVTTTGTPAIGLTQVPVSLAQGQDVGQDGDATIRVFPGAANAEAWVRGERRTDNAGVDLAWSFRGYIGLGAGGSVAVLEGNANWTSQVIRMWARADASANANQVDLVIPLKLTIATSANVTVTPYKSWADIRNGNPSAGPAVTKATNGAITGSLIMTINLDPITNWAGADPDEHWYQVEIRFAMTHDATCGLSECTFIMYPVSVENDPDGNPLAHAVDYQNLSAPLGDRLRGHGYFAQPWVEIHERFCDSCGITEEDKSVHLSTVLLGAGVVVGALAIGILAVFTAPIWVVAAVGVGVGIATVYGTVTIWQGFHGVEARASVSSELGRQLWENRHEVAAALACGSAYFAQGTYRVAAGAVCALELGNVLFGGYDGLMQFVLETLAVIKKDLPALGKLLSDLLHFILEAVTAIAIIVRFLFYTGVALTSLFLLREALMWLFALLGIFFSGESRLEAYFLGWEVKLSRLPIPVWDALQWKFAKIPRGRRFLYQGSQATPPLPGHSGGR